MNVAIFLAVSTSNVEFKGPVTQNLTKFVNWPPNWATLTHKNNHRLKNFDGKQYRWTNLKTMKQIATGVYVAWRHFATLVFLRNDVWTKGAILLFWDTIMADVTSREKARGSRGMSAGSFSRRAAGNLQNVVVFRRLRGFLHLGRKILEGGSS